MPDCDQLVDITYLDSRVNMIDCYDGHRFCVKCKKFEEHNRDECRDVSDFRNL